MKEKTNITVQDQDGNSSKPLLATGLCYVVECSRGSYEDYRTYISGIFLDAFDAEKLKLEIEKNVEIIRNIPEPFDAPDINELSDEQYLIWEKWRNEQDDVYEFNSVYVSEYPIGKSCR